ncbi:MAG: dTMP kinase [Bacteroidota bacterium]
MFVTVEGLDFCGKSTQTMRLVQRLEANHAEESHRWPAVRSLREPGGTLISERLREILLDRTHLEMTDIAELFLFSASRAQLVAEVIRPALERGEIVVCDRFYDSTTAYQGYGRGLSIDDVCYINRVATSGLTPDLTVFIDVPLEEILRRRGNAGLPSDRMEESGRAFYERVHNGFEMLVRAEAGRIVKVDGMGAIKTVEGRVWQVFSERMSLSQKST